MRLDWCYCSVAVLESLSLLGSGNDSGVKLHNSFDLLWRERRGYGVLWRYFLGVLFVDIVQCSGCRLLVGKLGGM